jgi:hypothetical protein
MNNSVRHPHNRARALSLAFPGSKPLVMISLPTGRDMAYSQMQQLLMRSRILTHAPIWITSHYTTRLQRTIYTRHRTLAYGLNQRRNRMKMRRHDSAGLKMRFRAVT